MQVRFCEPLTDGSVRSQELEISERKAHAARTAHRRKIANNRKVVHGRALSAILTHPKPKIGPGMYGSSDPFSSLGVKITPQINYILTFMRDVMYPAIYFTSWTMNCSAEPARRLDIAKPSVVSAGSAHRDWSKLLWSLQDEGLGLASLSACASFAPQFRKMMEVDILQMRVRSMSLLRGKLSSQGSSFAKSGQAVLQMFWLFEAEALDDNTEAAVTHGHAFRVAVESCQDEEVIDLQTLLMMLWADTDFAAKGMQRTMLSMDWVTSRLQGLWNMLAPSFSMLELKSDLQLNPAIEAEILRTAMIELRTHFALSRRPWVADECAVSGPGDHFYIYTASRNMISYGRLLNLYRDLVDEKDVEGVSTNGQRYTQATLTLAYLLLEQVLTAVHVNAVNVRDATKILTEQMLTSFVTAHSMCTPRERRKYAEAHLWVLFVGAMHECRRIRQELVYLGPGVGDRNNSIPTFLQQLLVEHLKRNQVSTLKQMQSVAVTFIHDERILPSERVWFESLCEEVNDYIDWYKGAGHQTNPAHDWWTST